MRVEARLAHRSEQYLMGSPARSERPSSDSVVLPSVSASRFFSWTRTSPPCSEGKLVSSGGTLRSTLRSTPRSILRSTLRSSSARNVWNHFVSQVTSVAYSQKRYDASGKYR